MPGAAAGRHSGPVYRPGSPAPLALHGVLSVVGPSVRCMDTTATVRALRLVRPADTDTTTDDAAEEALPLRRESPAREAYWARVQALRADRDRLRPAN